MDVAPATTWALVTMSPSARMMNPVPSPEDDRVLGLPPKNDSKGSTGTRWTTSVWTVTTAGATFATASVMAVRREAATEAGFAATQTRGLSGYIAHIGPAGLVR